MQSNTTEDENMKSWTFFIVKKCNERHPTRMRYQFVIFTKKCGTVCLRKSGLGWKSASKIATNS